MKLLSSRPIRRLWRDHCYRSYPSAKAYEHRETLRELRNRQPVLVYQMGKVGSTSMLRSLETCRDLALFHLHTLVPETLARRERDYAPLFPVTRNIPRFILDGEFIRDRMERGLLPRPVKVVTLVRDPVARNMSAFLDRLLHERLDEAFQARLREVGPEGVAREMIPRFRNEFAHDRHEYWFREELEAVFGVDVYGEPFPRERGYHIYRGERAEVLLLKLERLNGCATEAVREFLGREGFELTSSNQSKKRDYYPVCEAFQAMIELGDEYLERCYGSQLARHFYTPEEIDGFRARWSGSAPELVPA